MANLPKPAERKRRAGNPGQKPLPKLSKLHILPAADGIPEPLRPLQSFGQAMWDRIWTSGAVWLSPSTDIETVQMACEAMDERMHVKELLAAEPDRLTRVALRQLDEQLLKSLQALGFTPVERTRMGVAEVQAVSKLEAIQARAAKR